MNFLYVIILAFIAGIAKAGRDTIAHHFYQSVFNCTNFPVLRKWFLSDWQMKPNHPIWFLWDGWHFFDTLEKVCYLAIIFLCRGTMHRAPTDSPITMVIMVSLGAIVGFNLFYHWAFIHKS